MTNLPGGPRIQLAAVVLLGAGLRLFRLNWQGTWHDENFSLAVVWLPWPEAFREIVRDYVHPPLYYVLLKIWVAAAGFGDYPARLFAALFGTLTIPAVYIAGRRLADHATGLLAALLMAISQVGVYYSHEARMYSMAMLLTILAILLFDTAASTRRVRDWAGFTGVAVLAAYTHYYMLLVLLSIAAYGFLRRRTLGIPLRWWLAAGVVVAAALTPWLFSGIIEARAANPKIHSLNETRSVLWFSPISALNWFHNAKWRGMVAESPLGTLAAGLLVFTGPAIALLIRGRGRLAGWFDPPRDVARLALPGLVCAGVILVGAAASAIMHVQFSGRYLVMAAPAYYLLSAAGIRSMRSRALRAATVGGAVALAAGSLRANYYTQTKPDTRAAVEWVAAQWRSPDCVCTLPQLRSPEAWFWRARRNVTPPAAPRPAGQVLARPEACPRLWIIRDRTFFLNTAASREQFRLLEAAFEPVERRDYYGATAGLYRPRGPGRSP